MSDEPKIEHSIRITSMNIEELGGKVEELEQTTIEKSTKEMQNSVRSSQIFSILIWMTVITLFNFTKFISDSLALFFLNGDFSFSIPAFLSFIVNLILIVVLILILMYFPHLTKRSVLRFMVIGGGILTGLTIIALYAFILQKNAIILQFSKGNFYFIDFSIFLPLLLFLGIAFWKKDVNGFMGNLIFFLGALILTLVIADWFNFDQFLLFWTLQFWFCMAVIGFSITASIYMSLALIRPSDNQSRISKVIRYDKKKGKKP